MRKAIVAGVIGLLCLSGSGATAQDIGKLFFAHDLDAAVILKVNGQAVGRAAPGRALVVDLSPGAYSLMTEPTGGGSQSGKWTLSANDLVAARGGQYWCLYLSSARVLTVVPSHLCRDFVEAPS